MEKLNGKTMPGAVVSFFYLFLFLFLLFFWALSFVITEVCWFKVSSYGNGVRSGSTCASRYEIEV